MAVKCIYKNKFRKDLNRFEVTCYDASTGEEVKCEECQNCNELHNLDHIECRIAKIGYDNGITPGSSSNDCDSRPNLVRFSWDMEVVSWEVNGQLVGAGHQFTGITGWTPQLQAWADFFNEFNPNLAPCAVAEFGFKPAPTWRYAEITDCGPRSVYGPLILKRLDDGCIFTIYPVIKEESYEKLKRYEEYDCKLDKFTTTYLSLDNEVVEPTCCPECYVPCGHKFEDFTTGESECVSQVYNLCGFDDPDNPVPLVRIITDCGSIRIRETYTEDSYLNAESPDDLVEYTGEVKNCDGTDFTEPDIPIDGVIIDCDETIKAELFDQDVRIVGAKNPIPVFQVAQCGDYIRTEDVKLCEIDARYLLLIDSGGVFGRYSFYTKSWEEVSTLSVSSAGGSADVDNFLLYNFVAPDQMTVIDVNTDTQLPNVTLIDGVINPAVTTNPKTFSAASFRDADGKLYAQDTSGVDAGLYCVNVQTGEVDFITTITGVSGNGTSIAIDNTTDTLYVNGSTLSYQVDWVTGVATQVANPPIQPNGSTFDTDGNWYVTQGNNTYYLPAGLDGNDPTNWVQIIDDFTAGANSIAYYEVEAQQPSCFFRRYGILEDGTREIIGDFNVIDDSPRTVVGDVDCCECACGSSDGSSDTIAISNLPTETLCDGSTGYKVESTCNLIGYYQRDLGNGLLTNKEWTNIGSSVPTNEQTTETGKSIRENFDFNVTPDINNTSNTLALNDTNNTGGITDVQIKEGYIIVSPENAGEYRYTTISEGFV